LQVFACLRDAAACSLSFATMSADALEPSIRSAGASMQFCGAACGMM
jgi:hypothetical protein